MKIHGIYMLLGTLRFTYTAHFDTSTISVMNSNPSLWKLMNIFLVFVCVGETLLSPLVMCGPHGLKFMKPVELKLPHSASNTQEGWEFNLKSSDAGQGRLECQPVPMFSALFLLTFIFKL